MSEEKKPAEQLDAAQTEQELARKRNAFLRYMTIVFAVAFLLVLVSLVLQMHTAKAAMSDLKESNSSALTNAAANAELLQDDNRKLQEQVDALTAELAEADEARSAQAERIAALAVGVSSVFLAPTAAQRILGVFTGVLVIVMHRSNIRRLLAGTEPKFHPGQRPPRAK